MKLRFSPRAMQDLIDIADHIRERNPAASLRVRAAIIDSLQNLILFPDIGRRQTVQGVRKLVTRKYPYLVYYTVDPAPTTSLSSASSIPRASGTTRTDKTYAAKRTFADDRGSQVHAPRGALCHSRRPSLPLERIPVTLKHSFPRDPTAGLVEAEGALSLQLPATGPSAGPNAIDCRVKPGNDEMRSAWAALGITPRTASCSVP